MTSTEAAARGDSLSDRFLVAFARTEEALQGVLGAGEKESFRWLVRQAARHDPLVRSVEEDLVELSELRNAIVHDRGGGYVVAEPHLEVVTRLENIVDLITDPPKIDAVMSRPVLTCRPDEPVAEAAARMVEGDLYRLPVYEDDDRLVGMLTANALARWIARKLAGPVDTLREEPVRQVLGHGDNGQRWAVVARDSLVTDVVALFDEAPRAGRRLEAVLVTPTGSESERAIGIVTVQDLPGMYALIRP
ncbi:MAG: CBS domain-containing protein [Gemmatimonadota bacterium]|jgi:CBS domain-containing protein